MRFFSNGVTRAVFSVLGNTTVFNDAFTMMTRVGRVTGKVSLSSHIGSTSSEQHLVGLDWMIVCSSSSSDGQRSFRA